MSLILNNTTKSNDKSYTWVKLYIPIVKLCNSKIFAELCHGSEKISRSSRMSKEWVPDDSGHVKAHHHVCLRKKMKVDFGAHLPFYLQHEECERISNFTCRRTTLRHAKQAGHTGHSRRPSAKAPVRTGVPPAQLAPNTLLAARRRNFWRVFSSRDFRGFKLTAQLQSMRIAY